MEKETEYNICFEDGENGKKIVKREIKDINFKENSEKEFESSQNFQISLANSIYSLPKAEIISQTHLNSDTYSEKNQQLNNQEDNLKVKGLGEEKPQINIVLLNQSNDSLELSGSFHQDAPLSLNTPPLPSLIHNSNNLVIRAKPFSSCDSPKSTLSSNLKNYKLILQSNPLPNLSMDSQANSHWNNKSFLLSKNQQNKIFEASENKFSFYEQCQPSTKQSNQLYFQIQNSISSTCSSSSSSSNPLSSPNPAKKKRRRVITSDQRKAANIRERRRMSHLNEAFDGLRKRVPTFAYEKKLSRIETLKLAVNYIKFMSSLLQSLDSPEGNSSFSQYNLNFESKLSSSNLSSFTIGSSMISMNEDEEIENFNKVQPNFSTFYQEANNSQTFPVLGNSAFTSNNQDEEDDYDDEGEEENEEEKKIEEK